MKNMSDTNKGDKGAAASTHATLTTEVGSGDQVDNALDGYEKQQELQREQMQRALFDLSAPEAAAHESASPESASLETAPPETAPPETASPGSAAPPASSSPVAVSLLLKAAPPASSSPVAVSLSLVPAPPETAPPHGEYRRLARLQQVQHHAFQAGMRRAEIERRLSGPVSWEEQVSSDQVSSEDDAPEIGHSPVKIEDTVDLLYFWAYVWASDAWHEWRGRHPDDTPIDGEQ